MRGAGPAGTRAGASPAGTAGTGALGRYLARLGGGRQARVSPVVAPYGHHAGVDFVAQFQGEHWQQHDGGGSGEEGSGSGLRRGAGLTRRRGGHADQSSTATLLRPSALKLGEAQSQRRAEPLAQVPTAAAQTRPPFLRLRKPFSAAAQMRRSRLSPPAAAPFCSAPAGAEKLFS